MDQQNFYVSHAGEQLGPYSVSDIEEKLENNSLHVTDYVYLESKEDWVLMSSFIKQYTDNKPKSMPQSASPAIKVNLDEIYSSPVEDAMATKETDPAIQLDDSPLTDEELEIFAPAEVKSGGHGESGQHSKGPSEHCKINKGKADWSWSTDQPGNFTVSFSVESQDGKLRTVKEQVQIDTGPATKLLWSCIKPGSVDDHALIKFEAYDSFENQCSSHQTTLTATDEDGTEHQIQMQNGHCEFQWKSKQSGLRTLSVSDSNQVLTIDGSPQTQFQHGQFSSIKIEKSSDPKVGEAVDFTILAIDQYGNHVEDFNGEVTIKINNQETKLPVKDGIANTSKVS